MKLLDFQEKLQRVAGGISSNRYLKSVTEGLMSILPVMIIGAFSSLLSGMAIAPYQEFITETGLKTILALPARYTLDMIAIYAVFFIAYRLSVNFNKDGAPAGLIALISFFVLTPFVRIENANLLPYRFIGAQGLFIAIIVGLVTARLYVYFANKGFVIKMPEGVPPTVSKAFSGLIPSVAIVVLFTLVSTFFGMTSYESAHQFVYGFIQAPLQNLGGGLGSLIVMTLVVHVLWLFGIHGMMVILPIYLSVYMTLGIQNMDLVAAGTALSDLPNIVTSGFFMAFILLGGSGATLGLNLIMAFKAKSARYKTLGRLALPGSFFGINEPIIFGLPMVLNPFMAIPFIIAPLTNALIAFFLMSSGILHKTNGFHLPLGTPFGLSGILVGGIFMVALQLVLLVIDAIIYYPFFRMLDKQAYQLELEDSK